MDQSKIYAALDIGSSKIMLTAAKKDFRGIISVIDTQQVPAGNSIRRDCIYNVQEASNKIGELIRKVNTATAREIEKVYVGIGGQSIRSEVYSITKETGGAIVDEQLINSMYDECRQYQPELAEVLDIVSPEYFLDGKPESNPVGVNCNKIEIRYKLILGRPSLKRGLQKSIQEKNGIEIAGYYISPLATADAVLSEVEKNLGCALVEFGAGVTYLSVYRQGSLKYLIAIPLGGKVITKDLCSLNITENEAEKLKVNFGSALVEYYDPSGNKTVKLQESSQNREQEIEVDKINDVIEARIDEIIINIKEQLDISGFSERLGSGMIIAGGGAKLLNLQESLQVKTGMLVRVAQIENSLFDKESVYFAREAGNEVTAGLLMAATINCVKVVEKVTVSPPESSLFGAGEIEEVKPTPSTRNTRKPKEEKESKKGGFFRPLTKGFNSFSKSLFERDEYNDEPDDSEQSQ